MFFGFLGLSPFFDDLAAKVGKRDFWGKWDFSDSPPLRHQTTREKSYCQGKVNGKWKMAIVSTKNYTCK
jgi:hypothetical protein